MGSKVPKVWQSAQDGASQTGMEAGISPECAKLEARMWNDRRAHRGAGFGHPNK